MWFGCFLPQLRMDFPTILDRTRAAEAAGFDSVWLMDHLAAPAAPEFDAFEGWTLAAALLARTERIRVGHLVTADPLRHPVLLAKMAATVDRISNGRLDLGLGWGSAPEELATYGFPAGDGPARASRLRESIEIIRAMFRGEPFDHVGSHFTLRDAIGRPTPVQQPLPLHIGGAGERLTLPLVREFAHWWNCPCYAVDRLAGLIPKARPARASVQRPIGLAANAAERDAVAATAHKRFGTWGGLVTGTADEVAGVLAADAALGAQGWILQFHDFGRPETLTHFMAEVAPRLRG